MSPARAPNPDPDAEARRRRHATARAKELLREGMAQLQGLLDDRAIIEETPLEASTAMQLAADAMHAALYQLNAADSMGRPGTTAPTRAPTRQQGQFLAYISEYVAANRAGVAPSHADLQRVFNLTPPSVNSMLVRLERCGFIRRVPGKARAMVAAMPPPEARMDATHAACDGLWMRDLLVTAGPFVLLATGPARSDVAGFCARTSGYPRV